MKLPSTPMILQRQLQRKKNINNKKIFGVIGFLLAAAFLLVMCPAGEKAAFSLEIPPVADDDVVTLLGLNLGGHDVAAAAWANMNPSEKQTLRDQAVRIARMAQCAELEGLSSSDEVAITLRWAVSSFLADAWEKKIASETDLSDAAVRAFYEANQQGYMDSEAVRYSKAVYPAPQKDIALRVKNQLKKAPLSRLKNCVTSDWTEYALIVPHLSEALKTAQAGVVLGPLETSEGWVLYEVIERRSEAPTPFEKCRERVKEDMIRAAVSERLIKLSSE